MYFCECADCFTFVRFLEFGNGAEPDAEITFTTHQVLDAEPISEEAIDAVSYGVEKFIGETEAHELALIGGVLSLAGPGYSTDRIRSLPTYEADMLANKAKMTVHLHNIYRLARMVEEERRAHGAATDDVCYNCETGCGSEREAMLEQCIQNEWHHVRNLHIRPEFAAPPADADVDVNVDGSATTTEVDDHEHDDEHTPAQRQSPLSPLSPLTDKTGVAHRVNSFDGALDLRPRRCESQRSLDESDDEDDDATPLATAAAATSTSTASTTEASAGAGGEGGANMFGATAPTRMNAQNPLQRSPFVFVRPARFTYKGHPLGNDFIQGMTKTCLKGCKTDFATAPMEALCAASRVIKAQELIEYAELSATNNPHTTAATRSYEENQVRDMVYTQNRNAMVVHLLRIYTLENMRTRDAAHRAKPIVWQQPTPEEAALGRGSCCTITHTVADSLWEAMINREWAAFDEMTVLPETTPRTSRCA